jgi:CBS domain-containing protein
MHSKQVMTQNVTVVSPATAIAEIARMMREDDIGVTLVVEQERLIGVVTDRGGRDSVSDVSPRLSYRSFQEVLASKGAYPMRRLPA